ncbi:hypothetical protein A2631_04965 [Candidatus Daviesbacteria bacterium RIFCSPHIGHO2_01_FULL_44_29]|uniref:PEP-utilising enzyme mobile domain-containing protein n=1 Tax=Candidatus Daviesbacteria bacterium RIFCSPHIGHO2_02_FULL_43_12 TaxID=1797776 RepID=A0A1F5KGJ6_9BACT|nr:MAG: hypothetical protein A2631_04965 [Candidatus Daviesbacteria bacterium RIFCSPHIGHO2_01_FULL_44_29]OGE40073.1 MAG: hypothetical protein A3D25_04695 [Candidatus Daviesbacteria bacterium RIFCSPHIGHO2_02_FULL_43_12]OGE41445.1 MAG: hypothetical protein A3E86_05115 [Candidatus Daviesbacteria bacterium RIFCSPHIGHO2_12_FULL_47_45]OGE70247.1 MAG: hypothetical protein A3B55_00875 [Candidatus Daviesbacteria bacterium RIFCSPLOWO2_01_FULL_43_15]
MKELVLEGTPASQGSATGPAKILFPRQDISGFKEGDILVTNMTDPSMVLVMSMASAIVTDIGGVTAHAAILSRELGIPCVVATKLGTKTLKNGDQVYVDGTQGKVYKLK